ncbi:unnamed protein product [Ambrosiozyma monospora]|uniref:Unnamed protein product n=1 Tax=Ambrosiozyma monospora TaxID=43982 RepID=A0ACB5TT72_AMBMO|nr:unnamed protein product [Ambrosiozyma monospora]
MEKDDTLNKLETISNKQLDDLVATFINRNQDEIKKLKDARRPGRPANKKQDLLEMKLKAENDLYETGWKLPVLTEADNVKKFKNWKGEHSGLTSIKFQIFKKKDLVDEDSQMQ